MKIFLFIFLAGYAVRCDDSNYYVVQMPDNDVPPTKDFRVYWNVPTILCKSKQVLFGDLYEKYGILQNEGDTFRGDKISILYDPGDFPALLKNSSSGEIKYRNGGVPQEGDLIRHLNTFQKILEQSVPDKSFNGVGIIDFESWRPVLRQNFGTLTPYKDVSYEIEKKRHWWWKKQWIQEEAKRRFEEAGREFMQATLSLAKKMRPDALWGYYGFPYCFNMAADKKESCANNVNQENDRISWLWQESTALYPSVYSSNDITVQQLVGLIRGRVNEAARVATGGAPVLPYFWYRYRDKGYFSEKDLNAAFSTIYKSNASGFIIWGSYNDMKTIDKCKNLRKYVTDILGPAVAKYTKPNVRLEDELDETYNVISKPSNESTYDPEYTWIPPVNYTQHVKEMVDKELKEKEEAAAVHKDIKESILVDMILHKIANYCADGCDSKSKETTTNKTDGDGVTTESRVVLVTEDPFKKISSTIGVTVPTTTEDDIYDYETNEYFDISTVKNNEGISTTTAKAEEISINNISEEQNGLFDLSKEESSTITSNIRTTEAERNNIIIEQNNTIDFSKEEISSIEVRTTESNTTSISTTELSINETNATESTTSLSTKDYSTVNPSTTDGSTTVEPSSIDNRIVELSSIDNRITVEPGTVDRSTTVGPSVVEGSTTVELSSIDNRTTIEPSAVDNRTTVEPSAVEVSTTVEPSAIEDSSTDETSSIDDITTLVPIVTEQVLGSVSRAIVSKPIACSLFYIYSITKCLCLLLGTC